MSLNKNLIKKYTTVVISLILTSMILSCKDQKPKGEVVKGIVLFMLGDTQVKHNAGEYSFLKIHDVITEGDFIKTGEKSNITIQFGTKGLIRILEKSTLRINTLFSNNAGDLYLKEGTVLSKINKLKKNERYGVRTENVVAAIRGTEFSTSYINKKSVIAVRKGKVAVKLPSKKKKSVHEEFKMTEDEQIVEVGKAAEIKIKVDKKVDVAESAKPEISIRKITKKEDLKVKKITIIAMVKDPEKITKKELNKLNKTYIKKDKKIDKEIKVEIKKEHSKAKQKKIQALIKKKTKSLKEIKEVFDRIDEITLFSGRVIKGAIISRGATYTVLTTAGMKKINSREVKGIKVLK